jgi:MFS family permease
MCHSLIVNAVLTHIMPYLSSVGITRSTSSLVTSTLLLSSIAGRLGFGWLGDKLDKRRLITAGLILTGLGMLCFGYITNTVLWLLVPFLILYGCGYGGPVSMVAPTLREIFGRGKLGSILGLAMGTLSLGGIAGPPLAGWIFDSFGNYKYAWFAFVAVALAGAIILFTAPSSANTNAGGLRPGGQQELYNR